MKKMLVFLILACVVTVFAFSQSYTVQSVTGRVERESGGQREAVKAGDSINGETVLYTGIGSSVVLREGDKTITVPAARSGKAADLAKASSGLRISGNVARTDTGAVSRTNAQIATASARASDAAGDLDVAAE